MSGAVSGPVEDRVGDDTPGAREIGFTLPERYNASTILFDNLERGRGDRIAVLSPLGDLTYRVLCAEACRWANALTSLGLERGERVILFLDDSPAYPAAFFGAVRAGFVPVLLNTLTPADLLAFHVEDSGARVAVADAIHAPLFPEAGRKGLSTLVVVNGEAGPVEGLDVRPALRWPADYPANAVAADTHRDEMAFWMYSSGSTGRPKGIVHLQHDMAYTAASYGRHVLGIREDDICFSVPKIFFAYGFGNSITFPFSVGAASVLYPGRPEPGPVFEVIRRYRPTLLFGLPTLYNALVAAPGFASADFSSLRRCVSAAEVLSQDLFDAWKARTGHEIMEGLGSTEILHIYLSNTPDRKKIGAAGRRVPGYEIRLTTPDGAPAPRGDGGVMWVRGGSAAPFYWNRPDKTAETMRDGWIWTGDRLVEDEDGFFTFAGRVDDLIKVSGQWVYPLEIEIALSEHEAVRECAVLGMEMADRRMTLKAFVVAAEGHAPGAALTDELKAYLKKRLLPFKYPRIVAYVEALPKTGTGKIDRQKLREQGL